MLGAREVHRQVVFALELFDDIRLLFDQRKFVNRLRIVGDRAIRIDGYRYRAHAKKSESNETEAEDRGDMHSRGRDHQGVQSHGAENEGDSHQADDADA